MTEFLENFWGYREALNPVKYSFTWRHLIIFFAVMAFVVFFSMYHFRKDEGKQKVFLILAGIFMFIIEVVRLIWNQSMLKGKGEEMNFWTIANLDLFHLSLWFSIVGLFVALAIGYKKAFAQFLLNFTFSVTCVVAIIDILVPTFLDNSHYYIYHFSNLEYIASRALVILVSMFLGATDWLANSIDDMWMAIIALIVVFGLGVGFYFLSGKVVDVIYITGCPWIDITGIVVDSPWHMLIVALFFFGAQIMMYLPFDIYRKVHKKEIIDYRRQRF